ncbi:hypothetical protein IG611_11875 [Pectobacterium sp. A535-S3-A17]|uniref:hypothetical protein n=1 Tax=Pectobacterium quasiaquaticum TaxID=2774015 RepID=UPI00187448CE|nr:hypothetical protein [Pectobacterium quasiaquaticum]MBE5212715.1 hypothetical protein [Pectobacterium quasiaquaticum]MBE5226048.1 hypothetical protein [Pectobacterium quasiaquaticum]
MKGEDSEQFFEKSFYWAVLCILHSEVLRLLFVAQAPMCIGVCINEIYITKNNQ